MTEDDRREIERLRKEIDECDDQIFNALKTRSVLSYLIGIIKRNTNTPIVDKNRFNAIVDDKIKRYGLVLSESFIRKIYNIIHEESCKLQQ